MAEAISTIDKVSRLCAEYSGIAIEVDIGGEENATAATALRLDTTSIPLEDQWFYQSFHLPEDYGRGSEGKEKIFPAISGFQLLVTIAEGRADEAELNYMIQQYFFGSGWTSLAEGTTKGCHADGERVWMDVFLAQEIPVDESMVPIATEFKTPVEFRIGFQKVAYVEKIWITTPNPYVHGEGYTE